SHSFTMEDWEADEISTMDGRRAYFWVVPANVMGSWTLDASGQKSELSLEQTFQKINGTVMLGSVHGGLREARLRGSQIAFAYVDDKACGGALAGRGGAGRMQAGSGTRKGREGAGTRTRSNQVPNVAVRRPAGRR